MFIHPEVVMTAGHCCGTGEIKAICGGKVRPGAKLAQSKAMVKVRHEGGVCCFLGGFRGWGLGGTQSPECTPAHQGSRGHRSGIDSHDRLHTQCLLLQARGML